MAITLLENLRAVFYAPFYVAFDRGYFADAGVDLDFVPSPDPGDTLPRLIAGEVDVCWGGPLRVLRSHDENPDSPLVCFAEVVARDPFLIVGRGFDERFQLADLAGKRIGVVSEVPTPWICLRQDLADHGIGLDEIEVVVGQSMAENEAALERGELDAFQAFQPYIERAVTQRDNRILYAAAERGPTAYTTFYTTRQTLERRQREFRGMAAACSRAVTALYTEGGAGIVDTLSHYFQDEPAELLIDAVDRYVSLGLYNRTGVMASQGFEQLKRSMITCGFIRAGTDFETCVDNSLAMTCQVRTS